MAVGVTGVERFGEGDLFGEDGICLFDVEIEEFYAFGFCEVCDVGRGVFGERRIFRFFEH